MRSNDFKKFHVVISSCLTTGFEGIVNLEHNPDYRAIFSPLCILLSFCLSALALHLIKRYCNNLLIQHHQNEINKINLHEENQISIKKLTATELFEIKRNAQIVKLLKIQISKLELDNKTINLI